MSKQIYYTNEQVNGFIHTIIRQMSHEGYKPDYIVGLTRGGLDIALKLSHYLDVPMETLKVSLRDGDHAESNCWMAEDAFGYVNEEDRKQVGSRWDTMKRKNILIVDDINDTGATLAWIKQDWQSCCLPNEPSWETVWGNNVKFAVLVDNIDSKEEVNYKGTEINKFEDPCWVIFPWEQWWK